MTAKKYLLLIPADFETIFPAIKIALTLQRRGHRVQVVSDCAHDSLFKLYSIPFVGVHQTIGPLPFMAQNQWSEMQANHDQVRIFRQMIEAYQPDALVSSPLTMGASIVAEQYDLPLIIIGFGSLLHADTKPDNLTDTWPLNELIKHKNELRALYQLPLLQVTDQPGRAILGDLYLLRSIPSLAGLETAYPESVRLSGALWLEPDYTNLALERFIQAQKAQKRPLVYSQLNPHFSDHALWERLVQVMADLPYAFIADLGRDTSISEDEKKITGDLPANIFADTYIPLEPFASDVIGVICSETTTAGIVALLHGRPIITLGAGADGSAVTEIVAEKGLGVSLNTTEALEPAALQQALDTIQEDEGLAQRLKSIQQDFLAFESSERLLSQLESVFELSSPRKTEAKVTVKADAALRQQLKKGLMGAIGSESDAERFSADFGQVRRGVPQLVVYAMCEQDIIHTLSVAQAAGIPVKVRGQGHSVNGQSLVDGGILLVNSAAEAQYQLLAGDLVEVSARTRWHLLERALNPRGRSVPVLTDYLDLTVGGTLSVGGFGVRSIGYGAQADQVERIRLILPNGEATWCSQTENPQLFRYSLGGLGQIGIIEKVVMRSISYRRQGRIYAYKYKSLSDLIQSLRWAEEGGKPSPDFIYGLKMQDSIISIYGQEYLSGVAEPDRWQPEHLPQSPAGTQSIEDYSLWAHQGQEAWLSRFSRHVRLWGDYFFPFAGFCTFVEHVEQLISRPDVAPYVWAIYVNIVKKGTADFPFIPSSVSSSSFAYSLGVYQVVPKDDASGIGKAKETSSSLFEACISLGGLPYLYGAYDMPPTTWRALYGQDYDDLLALRAELDPAGLINANVFSGWSKQ